jgi:hypothetical protein
VCPNSTGTLLDPSPDRSTVSGAVVFGASWLTSRVAAFAWALDGANVTVTSVDSPGSSVTDPEKSAEKSAASAPDTETSSTVIDAASALSPSLASVTVPVVEPSTWLLLLSVALAVVTAADARRRLDRGAGRDGTPPEVERERP